MAYQSLLFDRLHLVRWQNPTSADVKAVFQEVESLYKKLRCPLLTMAVVPPDNGPPDAETRKLMSGQLGHLLDYTESMHFVIEGSGFRNSMLRSVVTNIILLAGKRGKITVHKSVDEGFEALAPRLKELGLSLPSLRLAALQKGVLRHTTPEAVASL